jgi:hypothetical protein
MKTIDQVLRKLSMLYDFNKALRTFTLPADNNVSSTTTEPSKADVTSEQDLATGKAAPAARR